MFFAERKFAPKILFPVRTLRYPWLHDNINDLVEVTSLRIS